jgi:Protein of unknown function (DUF1501)
MFFGRRDFLKGASAIAAAAFASGGLGLRAARARVPVSPVAVLVLDFTGAWDVHASFAARTNPSVNPHGLYTGADTGIVRASNVLFRERDTIVNRTSTAWGTTIPGFEDEAHEFSVIGAMRHAKSFTLDDHVQTARFCGTGYLSRLDAPGLGTIIGRYANQNTNAPPAVVINAGNSSSEMARAPGAWLPYAPLPLSSSALPIAGDAAVAGGAMEAAIDAASRGRRSSALALAKADRFLAYKTAFRRYRSFFLDAAVHTTFAANLEARYTTGLLGAQSPTSRQLLEPLGGSGDAAEGALALAFRCLEGGSRFVAVGIGSHDTHENEDLAYAQYVHDAQLLAGVSFLLKKLALHDRVLVVALSEMARSTYEGTFYNAAMGTDHGPSGLVTPRGLHGSNRQSVLLAHGPIRSGVEVYPADPEFGDPVGEPCITAELLAFLAECAGVERESHPWSTSPDDVPLSADALAKGLIA